jgi:cell division protein FtsN
VTYKAVEKPASGKLYRVQVGAYSKKENAEKMLAGLKNAGFDGIIVEG